MSTLIYRYLTKEDVPFKAYSFYFGKQSLDHGLPNLCSECCSFLGSIDSTDFKYGCHIGTINPDIPEHVHSFSELLQLLNNIKSTDFSDIRQFAEKQLCSRIKSARSRA